MDKHIVLISGKAQHGKDTMANFCVKYEPKSLIIHNADLLKMYAKLYMGWNGRKDDEGRSILQYLGTERVRSIMPDFWVDRVCDVINIFQDMFDYFFVPDCRFPNEIDVVKYEFDKFQVTAVRVERPDFDNGLTEEQKLHPSETALDNYPFDVTISNNGTLEEFEEKCKFFIATL